MELEKILFDKFGYSSFRKGQKEIIEDIQLNQNVVAMLPTGGGKSLLYQLPAYFLEGIVIVVSPLLSLMEDQVDQIRKFGEKRVVALNSFRSFEDKLSAINHLNQYKFLFISPEMFQNQSLMKKLQTMKIALFVIDEAHCISQWGFDFRPDYLKLSDVYRKLNKPQVLALTATATNEVIEEMIDLLSLSKVKKHIHSVNRENIALKIVNCESVKDKFKQLFNYIDILQSPGIVYCGTRRTCEELTNQLIEKGIKHVAYYHGGMELEQRILIQQQFLAGQINLIICTSAFGMGINKPNVRFVIHYQYPANIENYLQEIGRAGRDSLPSIAILLVNEKDHDFPLALIEDELPSQEQIRAFFTYLDHQQEKTIKLDDVISNAWKMTFGFREPQWHFILNQMNDFGLIVDNNLFIHKITNDLIDYLIKWVKKRQKIKITNLNFMRNYIHSEDCLRVKYLSLFNENLVERPENCCHICGINIEDYKKIDSLSTKKYNFHWEVDIRNKLGIGGG
ncbi:ATP-dependent DNA helicase RecQ [Bacillus sp. RG28]|uniref:ATP-dependent DNA helicase RecQ n=1 Tax=Gottfriedia endophytica TaxID=2820819 RepID=A0A940NKK9_9BACI|nr:ATP-dependent DNA helicase RecQ [Gottfriedia endophytica]MBP0724236.1 ATP-dependent DNA helicase RecQ [Gottfriedia endophytica]